MKPFAFALALLATAAPALPQGDATKQQPPPTATPTPPPARYELKNRSSFSVPDGSRAPFIPIGWVRKSAGPVAVVQSVVKIDESGFRVTSILLGNPALAVINGKSYEEGQYLRMPRGGPQILIRVYRIGDGQVWLQYEDRVFACPLKRPELGERKMDESLLSEERDVVPVPQPPAPAGAPAPAPGTAPGPKAPGTPIAPKLR